MNIKHQSLRTRIALATLAVFLVSIWSIAFFVTRILQGDMQRNLGEQQFSVVSLIATGINEQMQTRLDALQTIANEMTPEVVSDRATLQAHLEQRPLLQSLFNGGIFVTDVQGTAIADVPLSAGRIGVNYMDRESVSIPLKTNQSIIGKPAMGKKLNAPIFSMVVPLRDRQGSVIGAMVGTVNLGKPSFFDTIASGLYGKSGGYLLMAPQHNLFVTASDKRLTMQPLPALGVNLMHDKYMQGYEGHGVTISSRGLEELTAAKRIPVAGWVLAVVLPTEEAFAPMKAMQRNLLLSMLLLTLIAGPLTWWIVSLILRHQLSPMLVATRMLASQAGSKQTPQPLPVVREDEIGEMIHSFNRLLMVLGQNEIELIGAKMTADAANITKSRFLATMSHEIRTPMNGILGMAQLLLMPNLTENERREYARTIFSSGQTLLTLLNDILDLSKIEAGKLQLENIVFEPLSIIRETRELFAGAAHAKGLQLEYQWLSPPDFRYQADAHRVRQMLSNLVGNAIKFTKEGCIRIEGAELLRDGESALLEFSVSDSGVGIPPDKIDLLFKPFSQTDSSTTREFGGSGLGLSIVQMLAKMMGGDVGVESTAGEGSRFWFRLRAKPVNKDEESRSSERLVPANVVTKPAQFGGWVLVVEDNSVNCMVVESFLSKLGVTVTLAHNGLQALDAITRGDRPDLILMDLHMPVMDGYVATEQIRQWEISNNRKRLPIVALTADAYEEDHQHCLTVGMDDFLTKPIALESLKTTLSKWLPAHAV